MNSLELNLLALGLSPIIHYYPSSITQDMFG